MTKVTGYAKYGQLSLAAYAINLLGPSPEDALKDAGFASKQFIQFNEDKWEVIDQSSDTLYGASGFSAALFHNTDTGEYVFANRGTAGLLDLWADAWGIATLGIAGRQVVDMYRYYKQLITPAGEPVVYTDDEIDKLQGLGQVYNFFLLGTEGGMRGYVATDVGLGKIDSAQMLTVTGHSLGGHLSIWLNALIPSNVTHVYTYNGAGLGNILNSAASAATGLFGGISTILDDSSVTNIYAHGGPNIIAGVGGNVGGNVPIDIEYKDPISSVALGLYNHSIIQLTDAVAVADIYGMLDTGMTDKRFNSLFDTSGNALAWSLENALDALRQTFGLSGATPNDNREQFYNNLYALQNSAEFVALKGKLKIEGTANVTPGSLANEAKHDFGALLSLLQLSPIRLYGIDSAAQGELDAHWNAKFAAEYAKWNYDKALSAADRAAGKANFSDLYLQDRAAMLSWVMQANRTDSDLDFQYSTTTRYYFEDKASGQKMTVAASEFGDANSQKLVVAM